jgi:hypothetical protein
LLRLLKNRLPLVPDRPAAASVGRLLRTGRTSLRAVDDFAIGFTVLALPVRLLHEAAVDLPLRWAPLPFETREEVPVERAPLPLRDGACVPLCFPFLAGAPQRVPAADRALFGVRLDVDRVSGLRRAGRLLEADDAGLVVPADLRSCPFEAVRLKCGLAPLEVPLAAPLEVPLAEGLRTGVRGTWFSTCT